MAAGKRLSRESRRALVSSARSIYLRLFLVYKGFGLI
jgi:hypothetical protein